LRLSSYRVSAQRFCIVALLTFAFVTAGFSAELVAGSQASTPKPDVVLGNVDSVINRAIAAGNIPGAVLVVGHNGKVVYRKAYGSRALEPRREPMTLDTIFDLA